MKFNKVSRFWALFTVLWCLVVFATGCTAAWTSEALNIIQLLVPSLTSLLSILSAFGVGVGITTEGFQAIQSWSNQSVAALQTVGALITQYNSAQATAQPGILTEIQTVLNTITQNLKTILPEIHITNQATQDKVIVIVNLIDSEMAALSNLVPALKGDVADHAEFKRLVAALKTPAEYKQEFNAAVADFGKQYEIQ